MDIQVSKDVHLHVRSKGDGDPAVLLLHGWSVSSRVWDSVVERWPADAGRLLAVDLRGAGFSSKPREGYTLDDYTGDIVSLIDRLAAPGLVLVGHSMGGTIAMRVALERGAALSRPILISPVPASGVPFADADLAFFRSLGGHFEGAERVLGMMMARRPAQEVFDRAVADVASVALEAYLGGLDAWRTASFADRVSAIATPCVVMGGEKEQPLTPDLLREAVAAKIPGARFELIPGVNHYPQLEDPDAFTAQLLRAIRS